MKVVGDWGEEWWGVGAETRFLGSWTQAGRA